MKRFRLRLRDAWWRDMLRDELSASLNVEESILKNIYKIKIDKEVAGFIRSHFGELEISGAKYGGLLIEADFSYP